MRISDWSSDVCSSDLIVGFNRLLTITEEMWDQMMRVNMKGPFLCTKEIIPDMLAAQWGRIINISSSSAQTGAKAMSHFGASKGGVIGLSKARAKIGRAWRRE